MMIGLEHQIWENTEGLTGLCLADERGDSFRKLQEPGSKIIKTFFAASVFEAMQIYYDSMGWGEWQSDYPEIDKEPYKKLNSSGA